MNIEYKTLKDQQLYNLYVDYDLNNPWEKLEQSELNNIKYYDSKDLFPYMVTDENNYHIYFCAFNKNKIIGMLKLKVGGHSSCFHNGWKNWVCFISINEKFQSKGISRNLIKMMYKYAKQNNLNILMSGYSELGFQRIKKIFAEESKNYNVDLLDDRTEPEF